MNGVMRDDVFWLLKKKIYAENENLLDIAI